MKFALVAAILAAILGVYVLSIGPAYRLGSTRLHHKIVRIGPQVYPNRLGRKTAPTPSWFRLGYFPLIWASEQNAWIGHGLGAYLDLWWHEPSHPHKSA